MTASWFPISDAQIGVGAPPRAGLFAQFRDQQEAILERPIGLYVDFAVYLSLPQTYTELQRQPLWIPEQMEQLWLNVYCSFASVNPTNGYDIRLSLSDGATTQYGPVEEWATTSDIAAINMVLSCQIFNVTAPRVVDLILEAKEKAPAGHTPNFTHRMRMAWFSLEAD